MGLYSPGRSHLFTTHPHTSQVRMSASQRARACAPNRLQGPLSDCLLTYSSSFSTLNPTDNEATAHTHTHYLLPHQNVFLTPGSAITCASSALSSYGVSAILIHLFIYFTFSQSNLLRSSVLICWSINHHQHPSCT